MSAVSGVRRDGESRVVFATAGAGIGPLRPGNRVVVRTTDGEAEATIAIGPDQTIDGAAQPPVMGTVVARSAVGLPSDAAISREDAAFRARKAIYPPLGSHVETAEGAGTVVRIDLRHQRFEVRTGDGRIVPVPRRDARPPDPRDR